MNRSPELQALDSCSESAAAWRKCGPRQSFCAGFPRHGGLGFLGFIGLLGCRVYSRGRSRQIRVV